MPANKKLPVFLLAAAALVFAGHAVFSAGAPPAPLEKKTRILIVPGHDNQSRGAEYGGLVEADLTLKIGKYLKAYLSENPRLEVFITRDDNGYTPAFSRYFENQRNAILDFARSMKELFDRLVLRGVLRRAESPLRHNAASPEGRIVLYGVNMWANENAIDLVLHIHINDHTDPSKRTDYYGFSIYVPEGQAPNYKASYLAGRALESRFRKHWQASNHPLEKDTVIEDPDLIALGSFFTLNSPSVLIEYGYITESRFKFERLLKEAAAETATAINSYFGWGDLPGDYAWLYPYEWRETLSYGMRDREDIAVLQAALKKEGFYPPPGKAPGECPVSGVFLVCTREALSAFQRHYGISPPTGLVAGPQTRRILNVLYNEAPAAPAGKMKRPLRALSVGAL